MKKRIQLQLAIGCEKGPNRSSPTLKQEKQVRNLADLALLSQDLLKGNDLTNFINRSVELMNVEKEPSLIVTE